MCWDGSYECDTSDCPDVPGGTVEIYYDTDTPMGGFQFNVDGATVIGASGGAAGAAEFTISNNETTVLGFSFSGTTIPAGDGVLVVLDVEGDVDAACLSGLVISDGDGNSMDVSVANCTTIER